MVTAERLPVVVPADWVAGPQQGRWTYKDYAAIPEDGHRYEVVNGVLYMSPSPNVWHQNIVFEIATHLRNAVQTSGLGRAFIAPLDVELSYGNVVQPDVFVLLNEHFDRITKSRIIGAPDLVVEVASPSTARHDLRTKLDATQVQGCLNIGWSIPKLRQLSCSFWKMIYTSRLVSSVVRLLFIASTSRFACGG